MKSLRFLAVLLAAVLGSMGLGAQSLPYAEDFETAATGQGNVPTYWLVAEGSVYVNNVSSSYAHSGYRYLHFGGSGTNTVVLPDFSVSAQGLRLTFWETPEGTSNSGTLYVGYVTNAGDMSSFVPVISVNCYDRLAQNYDGGRHEVTFEQAPAGARIAIRQAVGTSGFWFVDDVEVEVLPDCQTPRDLYTSGLTQSSAVLNWSVPGAGAFGDVPTKYRLKVTDEAGNVVVNNQTITVAQCSYQISGLTANTTYMVELTGDCSDNFHDISNTATFSFTTLDLAVSVPYYENFDGLTDLPTVYNSGASLQSGVKYGVSGKAVQLTPTASRQAYVIFPLLDVAADDVEMSFMMRGGSNTMTRIQVGYLTDPSDIASTFAPVHYDSVTTTGWREYRFNTSVVGDTTNPVMMMVLVDNGQTSTVYLDEVNIHTIPSCTRPEHLTVTAYDAHSVTLDWDMTNAPSVLVRIKNMGNATVTTQSVTALPCVITGLDANTAYQFTAQGVCSATDSSEITLPVSCTTLCDVADSPLFAEGFESLANNSAPECWLEGWYYKGSSTVTVPFAASGSYHHGGSKAMALLDQANGTVSYLTTQGLPIDQAGKYMLTVWVYRQSAQSYPREGLSFWASPNPTDTAGGTLLGEVRRNYSSAPAETAPGWYRYDFPIPVAGTQYIIIVGRSQYGAATYFDDLEVKLAPTCLRVKDINFSNLTSSSYDMAWTAGGSETQWQIEYQLKQGTRVVKDTTVVVNQTSYSFTGLTENTTYSLTGEVRAICAAGDTAEALAFASGSFTTMCGYLAEIPTTWGFESSELPSGSETYKLPVCWNRINDATYAYFSGYPYSEETSSSHSGSRALHFYGASGYADNMYAVLPAVDPVHPLNTLRLKFYAKLESAVPQNLVVGVMANSFDAATFVPVDTVTVSDVIHSLYIASFENYRGSGLYPAIYFRASAGVAVYVDDLTIEEIPSCVDLEGGLSLSDISSSAIRVTVNDATATDWRLAYAKGNGAFVTIDIHGVLDTLLTGLDEAVLYSFKACRICGTEVSPWTETFTAYTTTVPATIPYVCGFEDNAENAKWHHADFGTNRFVVGTASSGVYDGVAGMYVSNDGTSYNYATGSASNTYVYRTIHFESKGYQIEFKWKANGEDESYDFGKAVLCSTSKNLDPTTSSFYYTTAAIMDTIATFEPMSDGRYVLNKTTVSAGTSGNDWQSVSRFLDMTGKEGDYNLVFQWCNDAMLGSNPPLAIDNINIYELTCIPPSAEAMIVSSLSSNDATLSIAQNNVPEWEVVIDTENIDVEHIPNNPFYRQVTQVNSVTVNNLTSNTEYYYAVRAICGVSDTSDWSAVGRFHTYCSAVNVPFVETFEDAASTNCWTPLNDTTATSPVSHNTFYHYEGLGSMMISKATVVSPEFIVDSLTHYMASGWVYCSQDSAVLGLGVMTDPNDVSTFEPIGDGTLVPQKNTWTEFTAYFTELNAENYPDEDYDTPAENPRYAKHIVLISSDKTVYVDNLSVVLTPECPKPTQPQITNVTAHSFDLTFTSNGGETAWVVYLNGNPQVINSNNVTVSGLNASTNYAVEIASICGAGDTSATTACGIIRTLCDVVDLPYICGFEASQGFTVSSTYDASAIEAGCWSDLNANPLGYPRYEISNDANYVAGGKQAVKFYSSSTAYVYLVMPEMSAPISNAIVKFKARVESTTHSGNIELGYMTDPEIESTWRTVYTARSSTDFVDCEAIMTSAPAGARIAFRYGGGSSNNYFAGLDDVQVKEILSCSDPNTPVISDITGSTANVAFSDTCRSHHAWEYVYGPYENFDASALTPTAISNTSFSLSGLTDDTDYTVAVRAVCGEGDESNWVNAEFHTLCMPRVVTKANPYVWSFEDATANNYYSNICYETDGRNSSSFGQYGVFGQQNTADASYEYHFARTGSACLMPYMYGNYTPYGVAFMRQFHFEEGKVYKARVYVTNPTASGTLNVKILYGETSTMLNMTEAESVDVPYVNYQYSYGSPIVYDFTLGYQPVDGYIAVPETGDYYVCVKFTSTSSSGANCYVDDFTVEESAPCFPTNGSVTDVTDNTAIVEMADTDATASYEYYVLDVNGETVVASTTFTGPTTTIAGLASSTTYTLYFRHVCGDDVYSDWKNTSFRTACSAAAVPYVCGFEAAEGFEGSSGFIAGALEGGCWSVLNATSSAPSYCIDNNADKAISGAQSLKMIGSIVTPIFCIFPELDAPLSSLQIQFTARREGTSSGHLTLGYLTDITDASSWVHLVSCPDNLSNTAQEYDLSDYTIPENARLAFRYGNAQNNNWCYWVDDISVTMAPSCPTPRTAPVVSSTTMATMNVDVDMAGKPVAEVAYLVKTPTTSAADIDPANVVRTTTESVVVTGLTASTSYAVYYRYICAEGDTSEWSAMGVGTTTDSDCFEPQNLRVVGILNDHHVNIVWGKAPEAISYEWELIKNNTVIASGDTAAALIDTMMFDNLTASTPYSFQVRTICASDTTVWKIIGFTTTAPTHTMPFICNFEDAAINSSWILSNSSVNNFIVGTDVSNGGSSALYVSNGTGDYYYSTNSTSTAYAQVLVELPAGKTMVSFDWKGEGEAGFDYGYAYLIPAITSVEYLSIPVNAIVLADDRLQGVSEWQTFNKVINVTTPGVYALTFTWFNDGTMGSGEPLAIDNVAIQEVVCVPANSANVISVTSSSATVVVNKPNSSDIEWALTTVDDADALTDLNYVVSGKTSDTIVISGLQPNTQYYFFARNVCDATEKSPFVRTVVTTAKASIELPYVCSFEANEDLDSWSMDDSGVNYFMVGTAESSAGSRALYVTADGSSAGYNNNGTCYAYAPVAFGPGVYDISYRWKAAGETYFDYGHAFLLPGVAYPETDVMLSGMSPTTVPTIEGTISLDGTYNELSVRTDWMEMNAEVAFTDSTVMTLCFAWHSDIASVHAPGLCIDEISIARQSCMTIQQTDITVAALTTDMFTIHFVNGNEGASTNYVVALDAAFNDTVAMGTVASTDSTFTVNNLQDGTEYYVRMTSDCGTDGLSNSTDFLVSTVCDTIRAFPYVQDFESIEKLSSEAVARACYVVTPEPTSSQYAYVVESPLYAYTGNKGLFVSNGMVEGFTQILQLPAMANLNGKRLTFWHKGYGTQSYYITLNVGYVLNGVFTSIEEATKGSNWTKYERTLANIPAGATLAMKFTGQYYYWIDDIRISELVSGSVYNDTICYGSAYNGHGIQKSFAQMHAGDNQFTEIVEATEFGVADSLITVNVYMRPEIRSDSYDTVCAGTPYVKDGWNIANPSSSLPYTQRFVAACGCDSFVTLHLFVVPTTETIKDTICQGDVYVYGDQVLTQTGSYTTTVINQYGCSVDQVLQLFVVDSAITVNATICEGDAYEFEGQSYTQAGSYSAMTTGINGCPLKKTLVLKVNSTDSICNVSFCQGGSVQVADTLITTAGTYSLFRLNGSCDITYHITATEIPAPVGDVYDLACEGHAYSGYGIGGLVVTGDTVITVTTRTADGLCDSVNNVHLTFVETKYGSEHVTIAKGETYEWYDNTYSTTGEYTETLQSEDGCDSVVTLYLTVVDGVETVNGVKVDIVPNPVRPGMTAYVYGEFGEVEAVEILNNLGQVVERFVPGSYPIEVEGLETEGLYYVRVITRMGEIYSEKLIVK